MLLSTLWYLQKDFGTAHQANFTYAIRLTVEAELMRSTTELEIISPLFPRLTRCEMKAASVLVARPNIVLFVACSSFGALMHPEPESDNYGSLCVEERLCC